MANSNADPYIWLSRTNPYVDFAKLCVGTTTIMIFILPVLMQMILCVTWEKLNEIVFKIFASNNEKENPKSKGSFHSLLLRLNIFHHPEDIFMAPTSLFHGIVMPLWFFYELLSGAQNLARGKSINWIRACLYNIVRLGPMYKSFMNVYVLTHKEAHNNGSLFSNKGRNMFRNLYNHWIGIFHGIVPGVFTISHIENHHKYSNSDLDVYSTAFRPRDEFSGYAKNFVEFFLYASNVSSILAFLQEKRYKLAWGCVRGTAFYIVFLSVCAKLNLPFTFIALIYPFFEANILLHMVSYTWHAFIDEKYPHDEYINSTTIVEGLNFTLSEEYHAVHHLYPGIHWKKNESLYHKAMKSKLESPPTIFYRANVFQIFFLIVTKNYEGLVKLYHRPVLSKYTNEEALEKILRRRLQCHGPSLARSIRQK